MKASDYTADFLRSKGIEYVFGLQGGAVVHLFDSFARLWPAPIYCHNEQAAAFAAVAYARTSGRCGCCVVTTGPAATNALTGCLAAWQDSIPVLFISGQTRAEHTSYGKPVRQVGSQEFGILDVVESMTKGRTLVRLTSVLPQILSNAYETAMSGRKGPVWIDFPVDVQWTELPS